jgi:hypothetical protein
LGSSAPISATIFSMLRACQCLLAAIAAATLKVLRMQQKRELRVIKMQKPWQTAGAKLFLPNALQRLS